MSPSSFLVISRKLKTAAKPDPKCREQQPGVLVPNSRSVTRSADSPQEGPWKQALSPNPHVHFLPNVALPFTSCQNPK